MGRRTPMAHLFQRHALSFPQRGEEAVWVVDLQRLLFVVPFDFSTMDGMVMAVDVHRDQKGVIPNRKDFAAMSWPIDGLGALVVNAGHPKSRNVSLFDLSTTSPKILQIGIQRERCIGIGG